jgi:hypothetical integral membrane protein (TIGR02206 family)
MDGSSADQFTAYGTSHQVVIVLLLVGAMVLVRAGRSHRDSRIGVLIGRALAAALLTITVPLQLLYFTPTYWSLERTLPLQLCDLAWMAAAYALWTRRRWAVSLTYYWGLTLTTQAILTPDLAAEFPDPVFLLFWAMHLLVVWAAVYLTWGLGLTPDWRSYRTALLVTTVWGLTMFGFNAVAGTNYGYLNAKPESASILDLLGPWPWYVLAEGLVIVVVWALLTWPWVAVNRERPTRPMPRRRRRAPR